MTYDLRRVHAVNIGATSFGVKPRAPGMPEAGITPSRTTTKGLGPQAINIYDPTTRCDDQPGYDPALYYPGTCVRLPAPPPAPASASEPAPPPPDAPAVAQVPPFVWWLLGGGLAAAVAVSAVALIRSR